MKIQILGSGCASCKKLFEMTKEAVRELKLKEEVEYITDISRIIEMGVMSTPVLAIDGKTVTVGFVPDIEKLKRILSDQISTRECYCAEGDVSGENRGVCKNDQDSTCRCKGDC